MYDGTTWKTKTKAFPELQKTVDSYITGLVKWQIKILVLVADLISLHLTITALNNTAIIVVMGFNAEDFENCKHQNMSFLIFCNEYLT